MFNKIKIQLISNEGATSILVLFTMIILITLSAFAFSSANINYKFSKKAVLWEKNYYNLDSEGERYLMDVGIALKRAELKAIDYMLLGGYQHFSFEDIDEFVQSEFHKFSLNANSNESSLKIISHRIYAYYAYIEINKLRDEYDNLIITPLKTDGLIESLSTEINLSLKNITDDESFNDNFFLKIELAIMPFNYSVKETKNVINIARDNTNVDISKNTDSTRYKIIEWAQWSNTVKASSSN
jgi:hypothetical protein